MTRAHRLGALLTGWLTAACATGVPTQHLLSRTSPAPVTLAELHRELAAAGGTDAPNEPPAIAVGSESTGLWGTRLDELSGAARAWRYEARVTQPPVSDAQRVVFGDGAALTALGAATGERLWSIPANGAELLALASTSDVTALLLLDPKRGRRWLSLVGKDGGELSRVDAETDLGMPAAWRGRLLVPWGSFFVSALDVPRASELGRAQLESSASQVLQQGNELLFGGPPWLALTDPARTLSWPRRPLPGRVAFPPEVPRPADTALTRLYALRKSETNPHGVYMASFGRVAIGFDGMNGALLWVKVLPGRVLSGAALELGFALCDASGSVRIVAPRSGRTAAQVRLARARQSGLPEPTLVACAISTGNIGPRATAKVNEANARARAADEAGSSDEDAELVPQLTRACSLTDAELSLARRFLSRELAARPEPEATRALIQLATRQSADRLLQSEAGDLLATRRNGVEFMLRALSRADSRVADPGELPPLGALADALLALGEPRAAALLALQLNRPGHSADALWRAATALEQLATAAEYAELQVFFSLRRTTADDPDVVRAVTAVGRTLLRIGGERGNTLVTFAARDALTVPAIREALLEQLAQSNAATPP